MEDTKPSDQTTSEAEIRANERQKLFDLLVLNWPKKNNYKAMRTASDDDLFHEMLGQNDGRRVCRQTVEKVFGQKMRDRRRDVGM